MPSEASNTPRNLTGSPAVLHITPDLGESDTTSPLIGHLSLDPDQRVALCGAEMFGIPAFGTFIKCEECDKEWDRFWGLK